MSEHDIENADTPLKLNAAVRAHSRSVELSSAQLEALLDLQKSAPAPSQAHLEPQASHAAQPPKRLRSLAIAAALVVGVTTGFVTDRMQHSAPLAQRIVEESIHNHELHMPLEVKGNSVTSISNYFHNLTFKPRPPGADFASAQLLGGRYCSIQSQAAAQRRYAVHRVNTTPCIRYQWTNAC
jgi:hypothetical protein